MPAEFDHPLPDSDGGLGEEPLPPLLDPLIERRDMHACRCAPGMSNVRVVVAPFAGFELTQRLFWLLHPASLPMQQPDGLGTDKHQPRRTTTVDYIDKRRDKRAVVPPHQRGSRRQLKRKPKIHSSVGGEEPR
jgi:hypothetical protein